MTIDGHEFCALCKQPMDPGTGNRPKDRHPECRDAAKYWRATKRKMAEVIEKYGKAGLDEFRRELFELRNECHDPSGQRRGKDGTYEKESKA